VDLSKGAPVSPNFALKGIFNMSTGLMYKWKETSCDANGPCYSTKCDCYSNRALKFSSLIISSFCTCIYYVQYNNVLLSAIIALKNQILFLAQTVCITEFCFAHQTVKGDKRQPHT